MIFIILKKLSKIFSSFIFFYVIFVVEIKINTVMKQNEKDLLLEDLCARLPYGVKISVNNNIEKVDGVDVLDNVVGYGSCLCSDVEEVKPYLFPLSSMTEERTEELIKLINTDQNDNNEFMRSLCRIKFYHINHFDYRGLIPMGLANDATGLNIY